MRNASFDAELSRKGGKTSLKGMLDESEDGVLGVYAGVVSRSPEIRAAVEARPFLEDEAFRPVRVTVSVGTAGTASYPVDPDALLARADAACYRAKEGGRNRVEADAA